MRDAAVRLNQIRADLTAELEQLPLSLVEARTAVSSAEAAVQAARDEYRALDDLARLGETDAGTPGPLFGRLQLARDELLKPAERARGYARAQLAALEARERDLRESISQIDRSIRGESGSRGSIGRLLPGPKRTPARIEYTDIIEPARARFAP